MKEKRKQNDLRQNDDVWNFVFDAPHVLLPALLLLLPQPSLPATTDLVSRKGCTCISQIYNAQRCTIKNIKSNIFCLYFRKKRAFRNEISKGREALLQLERPSRCGRMR